MILTENQSLQLTVILMEAAEDRGDKKGFLAKAKEFLKRLLSIVKEKIKKLKSFLKEKVKSLIYRIKIYMRVRKGEYPFMAKYFVDSENEWNEKAKKDYKDFKESTDKVKKFIPKITSLLKEIKTVLSTTGSESSEFRDSRLRLETEILRLGAEFRELGGYALVISSAGALQKIKHNQEARASLKQADKFLKDILDSIKGHEALTDAYLEELNYCQNILEDAYKYLDKIGDSKTIDILSKVHSLLGKLGSIITSGWSKIFSFAVSLIGRKKKEEE